MTLAERLEGQQIVLPAAAVTRLELLVAELRKWNRHSNLTAVTDPDEIAEKHLVDSLTLLPFARQASRLLDIGSGAGFPALPLKIACPDLVVVAVDAVAKKVRFQRHAARTLALLDYHAVHGRIEDLAREARFGRAFDLVTARALASLPKLAALARPYLREGGCLLAMKGPEAHAELAAYGGDLTNGGWSFTCHELTLRQSGAKRCLIELRQCRPAEPSGANAGGG